MDTPKKIGRYQILDELGHGAMGTVYRAKDPAMDRVVALKTIISLVLASDQGSDFRERFYREARAAGALAHPGIVPVFDVGEHEGLPFLVMEFISGKTLADTIKRGERMTLDRICELGQKIAEALGYAHQHGVVHRDIKPANILITSKEAHGIERPKITDFGVAKLAVGHTTLTGQILGTPAFMPPEQFTGAPVDGRADLFSLGVVLYWLATGEQPFPGESLTAVSYKVVHTEPVPPRKLNPSIPSKLESIILKCLAKNPDERYQTGEDLARDLGELRNVGSPAGLKPGVPPAGAPVADPNATVFETNLPTRTGKSTAAQPPERAAAPKSKSAILIVPAAIVVAMLGAGSWYILGRKVTPAVPVPPSVAASEAPIAKIPAPANAEEGVATQAVGVAKTAPSTSPYTTHEAAKPAASGSKKQEIQVAAMEKGLTAKADAPAPNAEATTPEPAVVDFNPKSLDPKANAKLKIEANHMPASMDFSLEMNGKLYMRRSAEGNRAEFDDLYVPPGVQEFRVTAESGPVRRSSNTVSAEFKARKRHTLKIELRTQGSPPGAGTPQGLYSDTQVVLTLK
jgi:predicted Ser/Thr protein kinase